MTTFCICFLSCICRFKTSNTGRKHIIQMPYFLDPTLGAKTLNACDHLLVDAEMSTKLTNWVKLSIDELVIVRLSKSVQMLH